MSYIHGPSAGLVDMLMDFDAQNGGRPFGVPLAEIRQGDSLFTRRLQRGETYGTNRDTKKTRLWMDKLHCRCQLGWMPRCEYWLINTTNPNWCRLCGS